MRFLYSFPVFLLGNSGHQILLTVHVFFHDSLVFPLFACLFCRVFANVLQHSVLDAFTKVLVSSPVSLEIFREEGIWDLIFSENFFHFGPDSEEMAGECGSYNQGFPGQLDRNLSSSSISNQTKISSFEILQMEVISFVEFAATCNGTVDNLVGFCFIHLMILFLT